MVALDSTSLQSGVVSFPSDAWAPCQSPDGNYSFWFILSPQALYLLALFTDLTSLELPSYATFHRSGEDSLVVLSWIFTLQHLLQCCLAQILLASPIVRLPALSGCHLKYKNQSWFSKLNIRSFFYLAHYADVTRLSGDFRVEDCPET